MAKSQGLKIRWWIALGYSVPVILSVFSAGFVATNVATVKDKQSDIVRTSEAQALLGSLGFNMQTLSRATRGYMLDKNPISVESYNDATKKLDDVKKNLEEVVKNEQQKQNVADVYKEIDSLKETDDMLIALVDQGKVDEAIETWKRDGGRKQVETITGLLEDMDKLQAEIVSTNEEDGTNSVNFLLLAVLGSTGVSTVAAIVFGLWIIASVANRMNEAATEIATSTTEIAATMEQQERTASEQAASVNETTTTMDELSASARQSTEQADAASNAARQALQLAEGGNRAVSETLDGMSELKQKVEAIADQILRLSEQTNQIGNISMLVSDIANRTNMLALNAAVEAVRAGEHGKGFAVVASEIRKLADQSKQSASKINTLVSDIQNSINSTVMVTDEGTKTVDLGMQIAQKTAQSFSGVADAVNNVVINNQQISLNIKQQSSAILQVLQAMGTINQGAQETAQGIGQTRIGTQKLNEVTENLKELV